MGAIIEQLLCQTARGPQIMDYEGLGESRASGSTAAANEI
jgi:hypothetical protein